MAAGFFAAGPGGIYVAHLLFSKETFMGLINPKPRFAYDPDTDLVYDYYKQRDVPLAAAYSAPDGLWDLYEVKRLILSGSPIEGARVGPPPMPTAAPLAPTPQPGLIAAPSIRNIGNAAVAAGAPFVITGSGTRPITGLSAEQLTAMKLLPLQMAAMGITPVQMSVTGVTATQVESWGLTPARADALRLTPEQRSVLMP